MKSAILSPLFAAIILLQPLAALAQTPKPAVIALVAAVGDKLSYVRQREGTGGHIEPFRRQSVPINSQALNFAVLRGLDKALELEEPGSQRIMLRWSTPPETAAAIDKSYGGKRDELLLDALREHLRAMPQRQDWDRIEAVLPRYSHLERQGMAGKLGGMGIYVQPLQSGTVEFDENGDVSSSTVNDGQLKTVNPKTGETGKESTFVAPYFYFDRITLDAKTLAVLSRKPQYDDVKYSDPYSDAIDVAKQLPVKDMFERLLNLAERSAFQSVRGKSEVEVGPARAITPPASAPR
ncbi:hypothetical protein [Pelomonas sp. SE-A7]|uniref:hypothetical protein n=1 Tax=Pelomonas sp. SE-A7 TaxID=3054953 RepID=UPI00259C6E31|nr:hypothetical protein [Pelomonas sp. SE-A7]MDM4767326.1 hypothetical protein [Pelomonas sp. SE-A7]